VSCPNSRFAALHAACYSIRLDLGGDSLLSKRGHPRQEHRRGRSVLVRFDLFSNQDGMHSLGFYSDVAVVPEPEVWVLVMIGAVIFVLRRRSHP
jgi:hypothetical protein